MVYVKQEMMNMSAAEKKININTIASTAKVSTTTVSNFINGNEVLPLSKETRKRIKEAMRQLNYRPHVGGVLMRRNATRRGKVGFILGDDCGVPIYSIAGLPLVQRLLCELELELDERFGYSLEIIRIPDENSRAVWNSRLLDLECLINFGQLNALMCDMLYRRNLPMIEIYSVEEIRRQGDFSDVVEEYDFLYWRNDRQIMDIFEHFRTKGARKFLFVSSHNIKALRPDYYGYDAEAKLAGFNRALAVYSDCSGRVLTPPHIDNYNMFREFALVRELLKDHRETLLNVDAVICHNDIVAQGAASIAMEFGIRPGKDVLFSGEGYFRELQYWHPVITSSSVDCKVLAEKACDLIELRGSGNLEDPQKIEFPTELINS